MVGSDVGLRRRPWLFFVPLRHQWDLYTTGLRGRARYYASIASFLVGVVGLILTPAGFSAGFVLGVLGVVSSIALLGPEWSTNRRGRVYVERVKDFRVGRLDLGTATLVRHPRMSGELAAVDDEVDACLLDTRVKFAWNPVPTSMPREVSRHSTDILMQRARGTHGLFNGPLIRQDSDLTTAVLESDGEVRISKTNYFSLICSNYLADSRIVDRATRMQVLDGATLIADGRRLRSLEESRLANPVGVSTLGVTTDFHLVLVWQHPKVLSSADLYAPAGSGSLDFQDRRHARRHGLTEWKPLLAQAMRRELCEECAVDPAALGDTEVLGYFRWLNKGAKPEYVGITRLNLSSADFSARDIRRVEVNYVHRIVACKVDFGRLRDRSDSLTCLPADYRGGVSMPLYMCLRRLGHCLEERTAVGNRVRRMVGMLS